MLKFPSYSVLAVLIAGHLDLGLLDEAAEIDSFTRSCMLEKFFPNFLSSQLR